MDSTSTRKRSIRKSKRRSMRKSPSISKSKSSFTKKFIIVDGTSSSGKTKICTFFKGIAANASAAYKCIMMDEYQPIVMVQFYKEISNDYIDSESNNELFGDLLYKIMVTDAISAGKAVIDDISQAGLLKAFKNAGKLNDVFVLVVYAGLKDLARNVNSRRLEGDYRGMFVFTQFAERYIQCGEKDVKKIDVINKPEFITLLKANFKFEFASEKDLITFADEVFLKMNIKDDNAHSIKLRDGYRCDYLLNTTGKTPEMIYDELRVKFT
jgi:hypothetical protein